MKISNLPAATTMANNDVLVKETNAGVTQKIAKSDLVKSVVTYVDVQITNNNGIGISAATSYAVTWQNFLNAYVIDTNSIACVVYTYGNLIYVILKNYADMTNAAAGDYTVRVWYRTA